MEKVASHYIVSMRVCAVSVSLTMTVLAVDPFLIPLSGTFHFPFVFIITRVFFSCNKLNKNPNLLLTAG
jgi:hypothetical protein